MKYFYIAVIITTISILGFVSFKQNLFSFNKYPYDSEQERLDEQIIIHFSHVVAENTPKGMAATKFAQLVAEKTNGQVIVQVYPNGILYKDNTEIDALKRNEVQMIAPTFSKLSQLNDAWEVLDLPFLFETDKQLFSALNGKTQQMLLESLAVHNIKGLNFWHNGYKIIATNNTPIQQLDDFKTLRIRIMKSNVLQQQFKLLNAIPVQTTFDDVFDQLENNAINSQDNTLSNIYSKGFHTFEKHITLTNHGILGYAVLMNNDFWEQLSQQHQQAITEALQEMHRWQFEQAIALNTKAHEQLSNTAGVTVYQLPQTTKHAWQQQLQPLYEHFENNYVYKTLLEDIKE